MIKLTFKVNGLKALGDLPPQGRAAVLNAAAGRVLLVEEMGEDAPVRVLGQLVKSTTHKPNKKVMPTLMMKRSRLRRKAATPSQGKWWSMAARSPVVRSIHARVIRPGQCAPSKKGLVAAKEKQTLGKQALRS